MKRLLIETLNENLENKVIIKGWIHRVRRLKNIIFIVLRDRSGLVQCVVSKEMDSIQIKNESVVEILGTVQKANNSLNNFEIAVDKITIISAAEDLPIEINKEEMDINLDTMLNNRVLSLRNPKNNSIFKVQHIILQAFREFLSEEGFTEIITPKIVAEGAEGGTELFKLSYFEREAYLAQSPQFYKQMLVAAGYERVFEIGNFFRAEEHDTKRHLNQFTSMDLEMAFIEDEEDIMDLEENLLKYIMNKLTEKAEKYFKLFKADIPNMNKSIPRITFEAAAEILKENYSKIVEGDDLDPEAERLISKYAKAQMDSDFIFITNYSRNKRPMYTMPKGSGTKSYDLIFRGMEITSGGQRIHDYEMLKESFELKGLNPKDFTSYINIFKYGMPPHGGMAIGLERFLALLLNLNNVRETSMFPRDRSRLTP